ncbi:type 2 lanthipeptide synthetase LanM family protein [Actinophytocola algeriensis]|uniref:Type 2 lantibiotic biosynthesis protein LanM n=1 Tax=Actinophytocola algeriensis TaxID=1768010 RepID=A0A7W7QC98_9PSEU|nr:type 2 lanthipeptide synthetase LanM family protein [Actinophytocola algeriensis]MBB4910793.1 type 2 lantibiotic biosynthesis protein LanM [Actinophytocola algeriensis]MBE1473786.1 type 2 lantibiotic biosynthesis protein LanM [Actinophytocola algeriensis]
MTPPPRAGNVLSMTDKGAAGAFPAAWWAPALALAERPAPVGGAVPSAEARDRVARWRAGFGAGHRFDQRLAADGLDEVALLGLLTETPAALAARVSRPAWADTVERAVRGATARQVDTDDWRTALAAVLKPFVTGAADDLTDRIAAYAHQLDLAALVTAFSARLSRLLVPVAARTFAHELNTAVAGGHATGFAGFAARLTEPARFAGLLTTYPVLARLLGQASTFHTDAFAELVTRFAADRDRIVATLLGGTDPGPLAEVRTGLGDTHRRGRSVAILTFADGSRTVYKPRDLTVHDRFGAAVRWLGEVVPDLDLRTAAAAASDGYGWVEYVPARPLPDHAAAARFYRRQGALLALLHALHAADTHFENVIAHGDQPVLVDTEALFHPALAAPVDSVDPAGRMLAESVQRTGLLPLVAAGEGGTADVSALGGTTVTDIVADWEAGARGTLREVRRTVTSAAASNLPRLDGHVVEVTGHEKALLDGFRTAYDAITRHRAEFTDLLGECADDEVRVAVRHSRGYARLLAESTRPELLRDGLTRDNALDVLWVESAGDPLRWRVCRHEVADLWALDVPMFTARPGSADLWSATGHRLPGALERPGLASALAKVNAMSEVDLRDQEWIIAAALATRTAAVAHRAAAPLPGRLAGTAAPPERLLVSACAIADQLVARTHTSGDRVNWLGLELVDDQRWLVLPMGASLGTGHLGVALFLAQVADLSGVPRYAEAARQALDGLPRLFDLMRGRPDLVGAIGCGGFHGFGGIAYGLARLTTLLGDDGLEGGLRDATRTAVELAAAAAKAPGPAGVASGGAGCLAAMTAVHTELGLREAADLAKECAEGLAELVRRTGGHCGAPHGPSGFADGTAGIAWALAGHDPEAAELAAAHARAEDGELGWCTGAAGLAMAGGALDPLLVDRPVLSDLSLCHGELGIAEALTTEHLAAERRKHAGLILDAYTRYGAVCGTPGGVPTPGLLNGVAGIGYGLLRLGHPERVPSVLLLQPSRHDGQPRQPQ